MTIDDRVLKKYGLSPAQFFYLLYISQKPTIPEVKELSEIYFYISKMPTADIFNKDDYKYFLSNKGKVIIDTILLESDNVTSSFDTRLETLAKTLIEIFPKGLKPGTNVMWRGSLKEIKDRLHVFFKKYGQYTDEEVINATQKYVEKHQYDMKLMHALKYFIWKKISPEETKSELMAWIENSSDMESNILKTTQLI